MAKRSTGGARRKPSDDTRPDRPLSSQSLIAFVATRDAGRAKAFYRDTLGLPPMAEDQFAVVFDVSGTMLRVTTVQEVSVANYTVLGWKVRDIVQTAKKLQKAGVSLKRYPAMQQDELGIWKSPSGARVAWFTDPDGNTLSITQF